MRNGRNPKSPAFQFYPGDYLSDRNVVAMTMEERGVHLTLLCSQWIDGPLPADPAKLARLVHLTPEAFARVWPAVSPCFDVLGEGTIANGRMERERAFQAEGRERRIEASKIATEARLAKECDSNRARIEHESSPPLSPTPDTRSPTPQALPPTPETLSPAKKSRAPRAPSGAVQEIIAAWQEEFRAHEGEPYVLAPGDASNVAALVKRAPTVTAQDARTRAQTLLRATDAFWLTNRNLRTLATRWSDIPSIPASEAAKPKPFKLAHEKTGDAIDAVFGKLPDRGRVVDVHTVKPKELYP